MPQVGLFTVSFLLTKYVICTKHVKCMHLSFVGLVGSTKDYWMDIVKAIRTDVGTVNYFLSRCRRHETHMKQTMWLLINGACTKPGSQVFLVVDMWLRGDHSAWKNSSSSFGNSLFIVALAGCGYSNVTRTVSYTPTFGGIVRWGVLAGSSLKE